MSSSHRRSSDPLLVVIDADIRNRTINCLLVAVFKNLVRNERSNFFFLAIGRGAEHSGLISRSIICGCGLLLFACSRDSNEFSASDSVDVDLDTALAGIARDNMQSHLNFLAADEREGRMTGSDAYQESAQYVADQFEAMGLEPGGTDGWMQPVPFITRMLDVENSGVILHQSAGDVTLEWANDMIIYADKLREQNRIRADVVFAGFGVHAPELGYSDFDGIDVSGKIVATFRRAPATFPSTERAHFSSGRTKAEELVRRGAIGQITLMSRLSERLDPWANWTKNLGTGYSQVHIQGKYLVTCGNKNDKNIIYCLDPETGKEKWTYSYPCKETDKFKGSFQSPIIFE